MRSASVVLVLAAVGALLALAAAGLIQCTCYCCVSNSTEVCNQPANARISFVVSEWAECNNRSGFCGPRDTGCNLTLIEARPLPDQHSSHRMSSSSSGPASVAGPSDTNSRSAAAAVAAGGLLVVALSCLAVH
eukprot:m51a1_g1005 hypothetical protein (133) ;mRNA; f:588976-589374